MYEKRVVRFGMSITCNPWPLTNSEISTWTVSNLDRALLTRDDGDGLPKK